MKVITLISCKGGIGKTTSTTNLGASLAMMGNRVLIVDVDWQSHSTMQLNRFNNEKLSIRDVFLNKVHPNKAVQKTDIENLDILPADYTLEEVSKSIEENNMLDRLQGILELNYDFIVIDCPPNLGTLTLNSLAISDYALVPLTCDKWGTEGFSNIAKKIDEVRDFYNSKLKLLGVFLIKDEKSSLNKRVKEQYREVFGDIFFDGTIRTSKLIAKTSFLLPVVIQYPKAKVSLDYMNFATEVLNKCNRKEFNLVGGF